MYQFTPIKCDDRNQYAMVDGFSEKPDHIGPFRINGKVFYYCIRSGEYYDPIEQHYFLRKA